MTSFSSLRARLVGTVFLAIAPAWALMYLLAERTGSENPWMPFVVGMLALGAAWYGGERFILRQVRILYQAARQLAAGDFSSRSGLSKETGELGDLARTFDGMAASLEERGKEREQTEKILLNRSLQQTVVSALGQFALTANDLSALLNQAVLMVAQTLEVEYSAILELQPESKTLLLRAGLGWQEGMVGRLVLPASPHTQAGFALTAGEPVVVEHLAYETRFTGSRLLTAHGVVSGVTVAIAGNGQAFGVLGAHTTHRRKFTEDEVHFLLAVATVLAMAVAHKRAQGETEKLAAFAQLNPNPAMELAADGTLTYSNNAALNLAHSMGAASPRTILPSNIAAIVQACLSSAECGVQSAECRQGNKEPSAEWGVGSAECKLGGTKSPVRLEIKIERRTLSWSFHPVPASQVVHAYVEDTTDRLSLEAQLRQSQKMESVGQLAAGVAHDFNNMLTIIQGHAGLLMTRAAQRPDALDSAQAIQFAAERAANLTRQLLMFSRKNIMQPTLLDLREVVSNLSKMLQRLLGETIRLEFAPPAEMPLIHADAGMIEQVIMNLAVNARDAMAKGGTLTISTTLEVIDDTYTQVHPEARPGPFVCLQVSDTGCGMSAATMARIFEPFFTTKEVGKGTGLGLATVYGIIKQHEGWVEVASEPGRGATFSIYLPASSQPVEAKPQDVAPATAVRGGQETLLVVEDEPVLRELAHTILADCGYRILEAGSGREALEVWEHHHHAIDLVLTDMVMPEGISGMELAQKLHLTKPQLKIIFASGYSMDDLDTDFVRNGYAAFLQKPYTHLSLPKAVRECLDR